MKVFQVLRDCKILVGSSTMEEFKSGKFYITSDDYFSRLSIFMSGIIGMEIPFKEIYSKYEGQNLNGKKLLAIRHGGGGDVLFMMTALSELKRRYEDSTLDIGITKQYSGLIDSRSTHILFLPICLDDWNKYHYQITFEGLIEQPDAKIYNAYDLFMKQVGLNIEEIPPENKLPKIFIDFQEERFKRMEYPFLANGRKKVGIQMTTSSPIRTYPFYNYIHIGKKLIEKGYDICFFGSKGENLIAEQLVKEIGIGSYNVTQEHLRSSIVTAKGMNFFIAPDSMFVHIAAAFDIPVIGIYGPFHSETRMKYFKNSIGIDVDTGCSPCFMHGHQPCTKGDPSPCFSLISPDVVLEAFDRLEKEVS